jgi:hypothetical protein
MPTRTLLHGEAPSCTGASLSPASFATDVDVRGQFLIDLEFLSRYTLQNFVCVYAKEPGYLKHLARLFPWVHFHAYEAGMAGTYDPDHWAMVSALTAETSGNVTRWGQPLSKDVAMIYGGRERAQSLVVVCHGQTLEQQLVTHALSKAQASLFDVGDMPDNYIEGELLLPLFAPHDRFLVHLVAKMYGRATVYDPALMREELGFVQAVLRATEAHDLECKDLILTSYAQRFGGLLGYGQIVAETMARLALEDACAERAARE